jgi:hypothetical protein
MIGAVNQHAGDTGRSHLANRYFFGSLHRGWPLDELDETEAARRASNLEGAPGRPKLPGGRQSISALTTIQWMVSALDRNRVMPLHRRSKFSYECLCCKLGLRLGSEVTWRHDAAHSLATSKRFNVVLADRDRSRSGVRGNT